MSRIKHEVAPTAEEPRNSDADANVSAVYPADWISRWSARRIERSSSTIEISGEENDTTHHIRDDSAATPPASSRGSSSWRPRRSTDESSLEGVVAGLAAGAPSIFLWNRAAPL